MSLEHESPRDAGEAVVTAFRRLLLRKAAELIRDDQDAADVALQMGLIDRRWLDHPGETPIHTAGPAEVVERFMEHAVDSKPSRLATLGLDAAQLFGSRRSQSGGRAEDMTVVFTDLEGFTAYTSDNGDEAALSLLQVHHREARAVVRREGGRIVKHLGDGLLCTFPDAQGGLRAAVGLLSTAPSPLRLRAGVHVGEAIASVDDVIGHVVNVAARVTETAGGGHAVATKGAIDSAGPTPGVRLGRSKSYRLKGISERVVVVEITPDPILELPSPSAPRVAFST